MVRVQYFAPHPACVSCSRSPPEDSAGFPSIYNRPLHWSPEGKKCLENYFSPETILIRPGLSYLFPSVRKVFVHKGKPSLHCLWALTFTGPEPYSSSCSFPWDSWVQLIRHGATCRNLVFPTHSFSLKVPMASSQLPSVLSILPPDFGTSLVFSWPELESRYAPLTCLMWGMSLLWTSVFIAKCSVCKN